MTFSVFAITTVAKPFFSFFFQFLWCQHCRLWKSRRRNTSFFIEVSGRLPFCHNFTFNFYCQPKCLLQESGSKTRTSCWMLSFKVPMKRSILCSSGMLVTLIFNFWKSSMCSPTKPFCFYQLAKEGVALCILIMCYHFLRKN